MAITHSDDPDSCPEPSTTPDTFMGGFCADNFTAGPAFGKFCWDRQPEYSAYRESSFGHGILEVFCLLYFCFIYLGVPSLLMYTKSYTRGLTCSITYIQL